MQSVRRALYVLILIVSFAVLALPVLAQQVIATIPVGTLPVALATNSVTNKTYVANTFCVAGPPPCPSPGTVTVIDGVSSNTATINVGVYPDFVAVNPLTNKIYVANFCGDDLDCRSFSTVTVIDGATNTTNTVNVGVGPYSLAVNSVTNKIYVANECGNDPYYCQGVGTITVIDGATNNTTTVNVGVGPNLVAVNPVTNKIYVPNYCGNDPTCYSPGTVTVIDGATNNAATINIGVFPFGVAVNSVTNKIYVTNLVCPYPVCFSPGTVTVIDGATNNTTTVNVGVIPYLVAVNPVTNQIYVPNRCGNDLTCASSRTVTVIDGASNNTTTVDVGSRPVRLAVDSVTNKIYVANGGSDTVTMIDGATNSTTTVNVGRWPTDVAVNQATNRIYSANLDSDDVSVIAGASGIPLQFVPVTPCRLVDTRPDRGGGGPIPGGTSRSFPIPQEGGCNIPTTAAAYSLNVSVVPSGRLSYLSLWPTGEDQPLVATLNSIDGRIKADAAIVPAGYQGAVSIYVTQTTNVILDINGYFAPVSGSTVAFYPLPPCRVADTRHSTYPPGLGPPFLPGHQERAFPILNATTTCNIPSDAAAYSLNFSVVPHGGLGYLTVCPTAHPRPLVSTLNDIPGTIIANAAIVPVGTDGDISVYPSNDTDLVIDINGYFAPAGPGGLSLYPAAPCRVIDTRHVGNGLPFSGTLSPPVDVVNSPCGVPATAQAYVFNATVVPVGALGYLTLWPDGADRPTVSTLNALDGSITNNMAIVPSTNGKVDAYASGLTQLILDISSYFAP